MSRSEFPEILRDLIRDHTPSMDHVAVLLDLRSAPAAHHSVADIAARTRLDRAVSERVLRELTASRVVSRGCDRYRLFGFFAAAFGLLFLQRVALTLASDLVADTAWYYAVRLLAFALIIVAIVDKNRTASS